MSLWRARAPSLLEEDIAAQEVIWLVYTPSQVRLWWTRIVDPAFGHVECWLPQFVHGEPACWVVLHARLEGVTAELAFAPPWEAHPGALVQQHTARRVRGRPFSRLHLGPVTCVELAKAVSGVRNWRVRTPKQLHRHIEKLNAR